MSEELPRELSFLTRANVQLAKATTLREFKAIRDMAENARTLAKSRQLSLEVQAYAAEIKLLAERRAGVELRQMVHPTGRGSGEAPRSHHGTLLGEIKINKNQSARWQREAAVPEAMFQRYLAEARTAGEVPKLAGAITGGRETCRGRAP